MTYSITISTGWAVLISVLLAINIITDVVITHYTRECNRLRAIIIKARGYE